jgi:hypothetical protein
LPIIGFDKLDLVSIQLWPDGYLRRGVLLASRASCQHHKKQHK